MARNLEHIGEDDSADNRAMHYAIAFLVVIAGVVGITVVALLWASMPFGVIWIAAAAIVAIAFAIFDFTSVRRHHHRRTS